MCLKKGNQVMCTKNQTMVVSKFAVWMTQLLFFFLVSNMTFIEVMTFIKYSKIISQERNLYKYALDFHLP